MFAENKYKVFYFGNHDHIVTVISASGQQFRHGCQLGKDLVNVSDEWATEFEGETEKEEERKKEKGKEKEIKRGRVKEEAKNRKIK